MKGWVTTTTRHALVALALAVGAGAGLPLGVDADAGGAMDDGESQAKSSGPAQSKSSLQVEVTGFRELKGQLLLAVFDSEQGFPNDVEHALFHEAYPIEGSVVKVRVPNLEPGTYAVAIHHDEDSDFEMDKSFFGIPREGYGASRGAKARFGPPKFRDARFELRAGQQLNLHIRVQYF